MQSSFDSFNTGFFLLQGAFAINLFSLTSLSVNDGSAMATAITAKIVAQIDKIFMIFNLVFLSFAISLNGYDKWIESEAKL